MTQEPELSGMREMKKTYTPPKLSPGETRADRTDKVVKEILEDEAGARQKQTERLRSLRLKRDESLVKDDADERD
ncbi:MAG: hypothetical protein AAGA28_16305 [Pseudomonadota bacterium]